MGHSRNAIRQGITLAMALISLLQASPSSPSAGSQAASTIFTTGREAPGGRPRLAAADRQTGDAARKAYGRLPLRFEANAGQTDPQVKFLSRGNGYSLFLTPAGSVMTFRKAQAGGHPGPQSVVRMRLAGANPAPVVEGVDELPGKSNYLIGNDPGKWRRNVGNYAKVRYRSVYPGIDAVYYGSQQRLEYDFVVAPGADPSAIKLVFAGTERMEIDAQGDLVLHTADTEVRQRRPVTYQEVNGHRREVASRYLLKSGQEIGFEVAAYDRTRPLVIDPVVVYSTYLGGSSDDAAYAVAVDADGNAYVTGATFSADFPVADPLQSYQGNQDVFVAKLNREGSALYYSSYLGGSGFDFSYAIAVDRDGSPYLTGDTASLDFPTRNPLQPSHALSNDCFVTKLTTDGSALVFSTYLGGNSADLSLGMAVDRQGSVYLAGLTASTDFPIKNALQPALAGKTDVFVAKLKSDGSALVYSTYLGGKADDYIVQLGQPIATDSLGNVYLTGVTASADFPTINPLQPALAGDLDAFVAKLNANGTALVYSTYLGGDGVDLGSGVAVDASGNAYLVGTTASGNFPTVNPFQRARLGAADIFVAALDRTGSALRYSTYLGGSGADSGRGVAVDPQGRVCVTGVALSLDFPTIDAVQPIPDSPDAGSSNAVLAKLNAAGTGLIYSTYLGGSGSDLSVGGIAQDAGGAVYVVGSTSSEDFPTTPGVFQRGLRGSSDSFIIKISCRPDRRREATDEDEDEDGGDCH